jgi:hypothetical protein
MRTSLAFMYDGSCSHCVGLGIERHNFADIEFRDANRMHYLRISGLTAECCEELSKQLHKAALALKKERRKGV